MVWKKWHDLYFILKENKNYVAMKSLFLSLSLMIFLQACSPRPVFRMTPQAKNTTFNQGTEYVHLQEGGIELTMSYYRHLGDRFVMDVEIVNTTDSVLRVDPLQFSYEAYKAMSANFPRESDPIFATRKAINPEQELIRKDMAISRSIASQKTSTVLYAIGQAASVGQSIMEENPEEREELSEQRQENAINHEINQQNREIHRQNLRDQREVWELKALRKTDLFPNEYIRGYLFFKNESDALGYVIRFNIRQNIFEIFYRQQKYEVE